MRIVKRVVLFVLFCFILASCQSGHFTIATWNIGHFANGARPNSLINKENYAEKLELFRKLFDDLDADVLFLNEYSEIFGYDANGVERKTQNVLFNSYKTKLIGDQVGFSCNAIFGKYNISNLEQHEFQTIATYVSELPRAANYYYISGDLKYKKNVIKLVCAHTISGNNKLCQLMIAEIIDAYKDYDQVIMCGDWNTGNYKKFVNAGFSLANDGTYKTYPQKKYPLDNIIVKGLRITNVRLIETDLSDHYPLTCRISIK